VAKKIVLIAVFFIVIGASLAFIGDGNKTLKSDGGPPYNTNAPGEKTCSGAEGANGCHSGGIPDNSGPATTSIIFSGGTTYVPGQTYTITPTISHPSRNRFGFQIVSLKDSNNLFVGTINLIDTNKTRMQQPTWGSYQDRIFTMHRLAGSYPTSPNTGQWSYKWTAPPYNQGKISFYACFLAANNNNTNDGGDETYYAKITINAATSGIIENKETEGISVYPNPASTFVTLSYIFNKPSLIRSDLINIEGKLVQILINEHIANGHFKEKIFFNEDVPDGFYFIKNTINNKAVLQKIIIKR
jgi:hypothetical protein